MRQRKDLFLLCFMILGFIPLKNYEVNAQDFHYSLVNTAPMNLNPALAGLFEFDFVNKHVRFASNFRQQWRSVSSAFLTGPTPFNAGSFSMDAMIKTKLNLGSNFPGLGISFVDDGAGDLNFRTQRFGLHGAFHHRIGHTGYHFLSGGIHAGIDIRSANFNEAYFDNQWTGTYFDPTLPTGEAFPKDRFNFLDASVGIAFHNYSTELVSYNIGISYNHINTPAQSFYVNETAQFLRTKLVFHSLMQIPLNAYSAILPSLYYQQQSNTHEIYTSAFYKWYYSTARDNVIGFQLGGGYRAVTDLEKSVTREAGVLAAKLRYNSLVMSGAYDINVSGLTKATSSFGAVELSLMYYIDLYKKNKQPKKKNKDYKVKCPPGQKKAPPPSDTPQPWGY